MKTIRDIIEDCAEDYYPYHEYSGAYEDNNKKSLDQALKELEEVILESLPEAPSLEAMKHAEDSGDLKQLKFMLGYQSSLEDTKANLLKKLGGKE